MSDATPPTGPSGRDARSVRSLLLDRRFQLKYTSMILALASVVALALGAFLYSKIRENSRILGLDPQFQTELATSDSQILWLMVGSLAVFLLLLALISLFV